MAAKRDMTRAQFKAALARNGFESVMGMWFTDTTGQTSTAFGAIITRQGVVRRRETLAHIIAKRREEAQKKRGL